MSNQRYAPGFKDEALRQVVERGYSVAAVTAMITPVIQNRSAATESDFSVVFQPDFVGIGFLDLAEVIVNCLFQLIGTQV